MPQTLTVTEAARHFANNLNRVAHRAENFVLVQGNKPVAELYPLPTGKKPAELPALCASLPSLSEAMPRNSRMTSPPRKKHSRNWRFTLPSSPD